MPDYDSRSRRHEFFRHLFYHYFEGDSAKFTEATGYTAAQVREWVAGTRVPRRPTLDYILHCRFAPDFQIVCEFKEIVGEAPTKTQLRNYLGGHCDEPGIYAFYDARAQLLYLGKATKLLQEIYMTLMQRDDLVVFPSGISNKTRLRWELVTYFSAYFIPSSMHRDHPKHVESLMLRISKPPLNKQIGKLSKVTRPDVE
jgi:hypothetical protein